MKSVLRQQRRSSIAAAVVTLLLGLALVFWPNRSVGILCMLLGAAVLLTGILYILGWFSRHRDRVSALVLLPGVVFCGLGVWMLSSPASLIRVVQYIFGAVLLFHGVVDLQAAWTLMSRRWPRWWLDMILGALTLALGVLVLINPFGAFAALVVLIGLSLVFDGASDLYLIWRLSRAFRDLDQGEGGWFE